MKLCNYFCRKKTRYSTNHLHTVDGRDPAPVDRWFIPWFTRFYKNARWCRMSSINSQYRWVLFSKSYDVTWWKKPKWVVFPGLLQPFDLSGRRALESCLFWQKEGSFPQRSPYNITGECRTDVHGRQCIQCNSHTPHMILDAFVALVSTCFSAEFVLTTLIPDHLVELSMERFPKYQYWKSSHTVYRVAVYIFM